MTDLPELLPCPFCAGEGRMDKELRGGYEESPDDRTRGRTLYLAILVRRMADGPRHQATLYATGT